MNNTVAEALRLAKKRLKDANIESWSIDSELLMCRVMGFTRIQLVTRDTQPLTPSELNQLEKLLLQRLTHEPMQYILGRAEFMGMEFAVNENTLIPRPDTEILVEKVIEEINAKKYKTLLDIGTGSGAIGISIGKYCPQVNVVAVDISQKALAVAQNNSINNRVNNITFVQGDLFENVTGNFDVIVSNPPYIETHIIDTLESQVKDFEPILALDGGADGLSFYRRITSNSSYLNKGGLLAYEIGYNQGVAVKAMLEKNAFENVQIIKDLSGLDRVVIGNKI